MDNTSEEIGATSIQGVKLAIFSMPFRPFFLAAGLFSFLAVLIWAMFWHGYIAITPHNGMVWWHGHEMIFGFAGAVLVGFLLTAAKNWTGLPTVSGIKLITLFSFWLLARILFLFPGEEIFYLAFISETLFWLSATYLYLHMIVKKKMWRNAIFGLVLCFLCALSLTSSGFFYVAQSFNTFHGAIGFFALVITVIGGRIIPFFTASATRTPEAEPPKIIELSILGLTLVWLTLTIILGISEVSIYVAVVSVLLSVLNLIRLFCWPVKLVVTNPMLWSLYVGYLLLACGQLALSMYHFEVIQNLSAAIHFITIGSIGLMIISMISRVSLGHTGRKILASNTLIAGFILVILAVLIRGFVPILGLNQWLIQSYQLSAYLWCAAFGLWFFLFAKVLLSQRADGKSG
ncbi:MAG: NnrS family protein [Kangiellaceae bacterium]|nr:NnrS family protein [Kangiellaceae bacterium]MCW9016860.1 NnrS family protein [Kangiellaceae bacterium]